jgi:hypothetical protein
LLLFFFCAGVLKFPSSDVSFASCIFFIFLIVGKSFRTADFRPRMAACAAPTPPMAEAARWLEWQGRGAVARTAAVALGAGAAAATAGAFIHAAFRPGANRWLRVPNVTTTRFLSHSQQSQMIERAQPLGPVTAVACRLIALTAQLQPRPLPLQELHGPDDGECDADVLVEAALATPGLRLRVLRLGIHALAPHVAVKALAAWGPAGLIEWDTEVNCPPCQNMVNDSVRKIVASAFGDCTALRVLRCDDLYVAHLAPFPSVRVATVIREMNAPGGHCDDRDLVSAP